MLNITEREIVRRTLLAFNLADHYVESIMTEIDRRIQIEDVTYSLVNTNVSRAKYGVLDYSSGYVPQINKTDTETELLQPINDMLLVDTMLDVVKNLKDGEDYVSNPGPVGPTGQPGPPSMYVQYQTGPRPQPYNHDRSQL